MKVLIIITRINAVPGEEDNDPYDEFVYWGGKKDTPFLEFQNNSAKIKVINGPYFYIGKGAKDEWRKENGEVDKGKVTSEGYFEQVKSQIKFGKSDEVGVSVHQNDFKLHEKISEKISGLKFSNSYSSGGKDSRGKNYYTEFYIKLAKLCEEKKNNFDVALFEQLWAFFFGDRILEAKLELLHACLAPDNQEGVEEEYKKLPNSIKTKVSKSYNNLLSNIQRQNDDVNCFDTDYITKLKKLRNSLFEN